MIFKEKPNKADVSKIKLNLSDVIENKFHIVLEDIVSNEFEKR